MLPLVMAGLGAVSPLLEMATGKNKMERMEDPITTQALQQMRSNRERVQNQNPEAMRQATQALIMQQQQGAIQNALGAANAQLANQGVGGDIAAPQMSAITNSQAAIGAAGQFAGALQQNNQAAMDARQRQDQQLQQIADSYGAQAQHVNLIERQQEGAGNALLKGLLGFSNFAGQGRNALDNIMGTSASATSKGAIFGADSPGVKKYDPVDPTKFTITGGRGLH